MSSQNIDAGPIKKLKVNTQDQQNDKQWIVIKKKTTPLTISISDHSKVNRYYSHKSILKYIRYLFTQTCPNPMWLAIKRQSQIEHIHYFDIQIEDYLLQKMIQEKSLLFLGERVSIDNKGVFKQQRMNRNIWDCLLTYDQQSQKTTQQIFQNIVHMQTQHKMSAIVYKKYIANILTPQQMRENLYPDIKLPLYQKYHCIFRREQLCRIHLQKVQMDDVQQFSDSNLMLVVDCEMVTTGMGFQLARCTVVNYEEQVIFDQFFKPKNQILNYNTQFSGITKQILDPITNTIQSTLYPFLDKIITKDTILIGHSLENDFNAMEFYHPKVVDTSVLFRRKNGTKIKLRNLADKILNRKIQALTHDSKEDCLATLHLVQARVENENLPQVQKQYHLLRDLAKAEQDVLIVDHQIENLRIYSSIHFEKVQPKQSPQKITQIINKYTDKTQLTVPKVVFTRFQKPQLKDWEVYYQQIDQSLQKLFSSVSEGTVFFLNFQVNQIVRIIPFMPQQSKKPRTRPFLVVLPKN